jgi:hypothetical protein
MNTDVDYESGNTTPYLSHSVSGPKSPQYRCQKLKMGNFLIVGSSAQSYSQNGRMVN